MFREHEFIGVNDVIGGLKHVLPHDFTKPCAFSFLSDLPIFTLLIDHPVVVLPASFDAKVLSAAARSRENSWGCGSNKGCN